MELISPIEMLARCKADVEIPNPETKEEWLKVFLNMLRRTEPRVVLLVAMLFKEDHPVTQDDLDKMIAQEIVNILMKNALLTAGMDMKDLLGDLIPKEEEMLGDTGLTEEQASKIALDRSN